ncbi:glycosyltransferase family 2 protein [Flavitalea flava]
MLTIEQTSGKPLEYVKGNRALPAYYKPGGIKVSAVIITRNESKNIRRTLSKLYWCDEIVILDSYSTDDTVAICQEFGCRLFFKTFQGYGAQKKYAVSKAKNDWVLCLDADEVMSDALVSEIITELGNNPSFSGYEMPMNLVFLGKEFRYGKESQRYFLRLFNKNMGNFNEAPVHEKIELRGKMKRLEHKMLHYSYSSLDQWYDKCNRYTTLAAEEAVKKGKKRSLLSILFALPYYFVRYYLIELNFLNGQKGFYWSVFNSQYHFTKYAKIRELQFAQAVSKDILPGWKP